MTNKVTYLLVALVSLVILGGDYALGQAQHEYGSPEATAQLVLEADSLHNWRLLLAMAHPDALKEHKDNQLEMFRLDEFPPMPQMDPCMTKQMQQWHRMLLDSVYLVPSIDSLRHLSPDTVFARDQRFFGHWARIRAKEDTFAPSRAILGHVLADDSTAYVVLEFRYRARPIPDWPERQAEIMTLRRYQGSWRTMLDPHLGEGIGGIAMTSSDCR